MKNPNGYGTVIKLKGNRRRPYVVRKTVGWDGDTRIIKTLGYYATREEGMIALAKYNQSPYDIDRRKITMSEVYDRWYARTQEDKRLAPRTLDGAKGAYKKCHSLYNTPYVAIRTHMIQNIINAWPGEGTGSRIRSLFINLDEFAMEHDIIDKMYSKLAYVPTRIVKTEKAIFSDTEVSRLWDNASTPWVDTVLILLYSGWRVSELLSLRVEDVNLIEGWMRGGTKTKAGKGRIVPIHPAILPFVRARVSTGKEYLVSGARGGRLKYEIFRLRFMDVMKLIGATHTIHETRHTFRTWLDNAGANVACANRIMGHKCTDVGLQTYTHKTLTQLRETVELIKSEQHIPNTDRE